MSPTCVCKGSVVHGRPGCVGILSCTRCDVCAGVDVSDAWEHLTPNRSKCVRDSDSLQMKRQYVCGRPGRVGMISCARCDVCASADVLDAWECTPVPDANCV
jgi:hypothetical protein